jgi:hypothetical protein
MKITYYKHTSEKGSSSYTLLNDKEEQIGSVEGFVNEDGEFISVVRINPELQKLGLGYDAFLTVFNELNDIEEIKKIIGSWHKDAEFADCEDGMSTNLKIFLNCLNDTDPEKCVFQTATGKWAKKLGFSKCNILSKSKESAKIEFYK